MRLLCKHNLILTAILAVAVLASAATGAPARKVVLVVADYLTLSDLLESELPGIHKLVSEGGVGLICPGVNTRRAVGSAYIAISSGGAAWAGKEIDKACSHYEDLPDETDDAGAAYLRRTGEAYVPAVTHLGLPYLVSRNEYFDTRVVPGALAELLAQAGKTTAVFGNSDLADSPRRRAAVIAASSEGAVLEGDVSVAMLENDPISPAGYVTDAKKLAASVNSALSTTDFIVVDFGDTSRVEMSRTRLSERAYSAHRTKALANLDALLTHLMRGSAGSSTIILASLEAKIPQKDEPRRLAPIVLWRADGASGVLISGTTRTDGLVSGFDIAPTIVNSLGLGKVHRMTGSSVTTVVGDKNRAIWIDNLVTLNRNTMWVVLGVFGGLGILVATVVAWAVSTGCGNSGWLAGTLRVGIVAAMSSPMAMLYASAGTPEIVPYALRLVAWLLAFIAAAFLLSSVLKRMLGHRMERFPGTLPAVTVALIASSALLVESFRAGSLMRFSLPSTADFRGFRFYGIGNEYMGVLLGAALIAIIWIRECFPEWKTHRMGRGIMLSISAIIVLVMGAPVFGANAGGTVAAVVGLGLLYISGTKGSFKPIHWLLFAAVGASVVVVFMLLDAVISSGAPSHMGLAASGASKEGYAVLIAIAARKVAMNLRLISLPQSLVAIAAGVPFFVMCFYSLRARVRKLTEGRPEMSSGILAALGCAVAAFLFNDSGIVAATLIFGFLAMSLLYSLLDAGREGVQRGAVDGT